MRAYIIVQGDNLVDLQDKVEERIVEGFAPQGGVIMAGGKFCQVVFHLGYANSFARERVAPSIPPGRYTK